MLDCFLGASRLSVVLIATSPSGTPLANLSNHTQRMDLTLVSKAGARLHDGERQEMDSTKSRPERHGASASFPPPTALPNPVLNRLIWDFFGRSAEDVGRHFLAHLRDFLVSNNLQDKGKPQIQSETAWHWYVLCDFDDAHDAKAVAQVLKPSCRSQIDQRSAEERPPDSAPIITV